MTIDEMKDILGSKRLWSECSHNGERTRFDYCYDNPLIHCDISLPEGDFEFIYVTPGMFELKSGKMSALSNRKHFDNRFNAFKRIVEKIELP